MIEDKITSMIIDDEEEAISLLEIYLQPFHEIDVIEKTTNPQKGIKLIRRKMPNIVFLDIDMPEINGLEVAQMIKDYKLDTEIVFTTAYSEYAYNALKVQPLDYLIKPFGPEELISVINRYKTKTKRKELERRMDIFVKNNKSNPKIKFPTRSGIVLLNPDNIMLLRSENNYTLIFTTDDNSELITLNVLKVIDMIDTPSFVKVNRSAYVNLQYLRRIERKRRTCILQHKDVSLEEPLNRTGLSFFEKLNCFPIT
ncbi:LytR/AlgR family response regulator transcription factor [Sunxiuqinia sp. A32]|uniref:LytR/AlgR family response regulator transcription factor n=1 Tax=Sunxiuqinia sp. A32 TaxID=3461496 RepID=UPI0040451FBA